MQRQAGVPRRASAEQYALLQQMQEPDTDEEEIPDSYYPQRMPPSARRYRDTSGNQVIQQGNRRIVIHDEPPPKKRHFHWLFWVGLVLFIAIGGTWLANTVGTWWVDEQNNFNYGMPRTYQTDAVVGHNDSSVHPSHFIALNLNGQVEVIEIPGGDSSKEKVYVGPTIFSPNPELVPVTVSFQDVNGDGKPDLLIHIQGQTIVFLNDGKQFTSPK